MRPKRLVMAAIGLCSALTGAHASAHDYSVTRNYVDTGWAPGNSNYSASYDWYGNEGSAEYNVSGSQSRASYSGQGFSVRAGILGTTRLIASASGGAEATYSKKAGVRMALGRRAESVAFINDVQVAHCTDFGSQGCWVQEDLAMSEFFRKKKSIDFGTFFPTKTLTSIALASVSLLHSAMPAASGSTSSSSTSCRLESATDLALVVHVLAENHMSDFATTRYRLVDIGLNGTELARQNVAGASGTTGLLEWQNQEHVDVKMMAGKVSYTWSNIWGSSTRTLVDVPPMIWGPGVWFNDNGWTDVF